MKIAMREMVVGVKKGDESCAKALGSRGVIVWCTSSMTTWFAAATEICWNICTAIHTKHKNKFHIFVYIIHRTPMCGHLCMYVNLAQVHVKLAKIPCDSVNYPSVCWAVYVRPCP